MGIQPSRAFKEVLKVANWEADAATPFENFACAHANAQTAEAILDAEAVETLLLIARWADYVDSTGVRRPAHVNINVFTKSDSPIMGATQTQVMASAFRYSIKALATKFDHRYVLRKVSEIAWYSACDSARRRAHEHLDTTGALTAIACAEAESRSQGADDTLECLPEIITVLDTWSMTCDKKACSAMHMVRFNYFDHNYITKTGIRGVRHLFEARSSNAPETKSDDTQ